MITNTKIPLFDTFFTAKKSFCYLLTVLLTTSCSTKNYTDPLSPEKALTAFQLNEDFTIEIFASEPFVLDPVDLIFDEEGNVYVVEMPDYPYQPKEGKGTGRIRLLSDRNGDGRIDTSSLYADSLSEATSIFPWKGGLIVTAAPHIFYLKDTNGDFRADTKEMLFSGFFKDNSEAQITSLRFGIDNWIYANNRGQDGEIYFSRRANDSPVSVRGADFRFRLDRNQFEPETGPGQFGQTIDPWGHRFFTENSVHLQQAVIPWRYLHRHPYLPSTSAVVNISDHDPIMYQETPPPYWRAERTDRRNKLYQEKKFPRVEYADDHFTGASGGTIYMGDAFPPAYYGNIFTGDVAGNLVHRDELTLLPDSVTFIAKRSDVDKNREFLSSKDPWFRPVSFTVGPDGYLYVIDMYRQHIETPVSIPDDLKKGMNFLRGSDYGRIYRIVPKKDSSVKQAFINLKNLKSIQLAEFLASSNQWWAIQSQRLLLERQDASVIPSVNRMFTTHKDPAARIHALFVLEGLNKMNASLVQGAIKDTDPNLRENGLILSERYAQLLPLVLKATKDPIARVALQATLSLGSFKGQQVTNALAEIIGDRYKDRWFRLAVLSADAGSSLEFLQHLVYKELFFEEYNAEKATLLEEISHIIGYRNKPGELLDVMKLVTDNFSLKMENRWQLAALRGIGRGLKKLKTKPVSDSLLNDILQKIQVSPKKPLRDAVIEMKKSLQ